MSKPKFILTRFTHGSAGKFLSSVLQTSNQVDHWSTIIQSNKQQPDLFKLLILQYTQRSFPADHAQYLRSEPMVPYNIDLYSTGYPRGNDVTLEQYILNAQNKNDTRLLECIRLDLQTNLIFNKPQTPVFCDGSNVVTVTVTSQQEKKWLYSTLWSKHFLEDKGEIRYLPSDPDYCSFYSLIPVLTYNNQYRFSLTDKKKLYNDYVINNHTNSWYFDPAKFTDHDKTHNLNNVFITLDEILLPTKFLSAIEKLFKHFDLGNPNLELISSMHQIWLNRQIPYETH